MPSNSLPDADLNLPEMKIKSPSCPAGGVHMYEVIYHSKCSLDSCFFSNGLSNLSHDLSGIQGGGQDTVAWVA